ncbi:hypothetical protein EMIT051CA3_10855 [Pseudomonas chlororaphis]
MLGDYENLKFPMSKLILNIKHLI